jgi:hypothetical protein
VRLSAAAVVAAIALFASAACSGDDGPGAAPTPDASRPLLAQVQDAVDRAGGYTLDVRVTNLGLPGWGGTDSGVVIAGERARVATAELARTGDGGPYRIRFVENQTFFQRATCSYWTRVGGGGPEVLSPFLFSRTRAFANGRLMSSQPDPSGLIKVTAELQYLGVVSVEVDAKTLLPRRIVRDLDQGRDRAELEFREWGKKLSVEKPPGRLVERGPGGNPC